MNELINSSNTKIADKNDIDIYLAREFINPGIPIATMYSSTAQYPLQFYQTRESLVDVEVYKRFIDNCIHRFRKSRAYKGYKAYLMSMGLDRCQINGNIQDGMADIEMHHNFLTIYDITILISQHILNTVGRCTTFDIINLLIQEHRDNHIPIVMLSETVHQLYHANPEMYIPISLTFGNWPMLLLKYRYGITIDIAYKVIRYIENCQKNNELNDLPYYQLSNTIKSWGDYNEYNYYHSNYIGNDNLVNWSDGYINTNFYEVNTLTKSDQSDLRNNQGQGQIYTEEQLFGTGF